MKKLFGGLGVALIAVLLMAQTTTQPWSGTETQQFLSGCAIHNTDSVICVATDGVAFSYQGAAFAKVSSPVASVTGVTSFAGRTAAVLPANGDYSYSQISGTPTTFSCPTVSESTTSGISATGCTFK